MKVVTIFFCCICISLSGCSTLDSLISFDSSSSKPSSSSNSSQPVTESLSTCSTGIAIDPATSLAKPEDYGYSPAVQPVNTKERQEKRKRIEALYRSIQQ